MEEKKINKKKKENNKNTSGDISLKYNLSDQLDKLFPQYKPSKKKEEKE
jgi:hypothetical protein